MIFTLIKPEEFYLFWTLNNLQLWPFTAHVWCKKDEFACHSRRCISVKSLCDGVDDCGDGSDEDSCHNCTAGFFLCGLSDACLSENKLCDGRKDCQNGHDESRELCGSVQPLPQRSKSSCAASEFRCRDGACIRHAWRCDHSPDCSDGSDEEDCGEWCGVVHCLFRAWMLNYKKKKTFYFIYLFFPKLNRSKFVSALRLCKLPAKITLNFRSLSAKSTQL